MLKPYPRSIVPNNRYRYRLPMRKLLADYPDLAVVRRSKMKDPFVSSTAGSVKALRDDAIGDLLEMSVNLLGGSFKMRHLPFVPSMDLVQEEWDGHTEPCLPLSTNSYGVEPEWGVIGFRVSVVNAFAFPYTKTIDKKDYPKVVKASEHIRKRERLNVPEVVVGALGQAGDNMTDVHAWLHVNHHPTLLNYWHMQIDVYPAGSEDYLRHGNKLREARRIRHRFRDFLSRIAICEFGYSYHIGARYYKRGTCCVSNLLDDVWNGISQRCIKFPGSGTIK